MKITNFLIIFIVILSVILGSVNLVHATDLEKNNLIGQTSDVFGIKKIYETKFGGNEWYMNMVNPTIDPRFDPRGVIIPNPDGSWKIQQGQVRMVVYSTEKGTYENTPIPTYSRTQLADQGYMQFSSDWRNFEMTGYVKLNETDGGADDQFTWYGRGGTHNDLNNGCEGSSTKGALHFDGRTQIEKESWHVKYDFSENKQSIPPLLGNWIGFKFIVFNQPGINFDQQVRHEIWIDASNTNHWIKVHSFTDDGFGSGANNCGPAFADNMPITWGGPLATFRADNAIDFDFRYLSVREIQNNPIPVADLDSDGIYDAIDNQNIIATSITLNDSHAVTSDITIHNGAVLTIPAGTTLTITSGNNITIKSGGGLLIESGGTLIVIS